MVPQWNSTLLNANDLPNFKKFPTSYTAFRQQTSNVPVRNMLPTLKALPYIPDAQFSEAEEFMPQLALGGQKDPRAVLDFVGGEDAGLKRLTDYIESGALQTYKDTRNGLLGKDASSKFSPWFAQGSLSVVKVMNTVL
jgi:deoxyribodipyrimidine photo-lyase